MRKDKNYIVIQCRVCDPSTAEYKYSYNKMLKVWTLEEIGKKCGNCDNMIYRTTNCVSKTSIWPCDIIQCEKCRPVHKYIKFEWIGF